MKYFFLITGLFVGGMALSQPKGPEFVTEKYEPIEREATSLKQQQSFESAMVSAFRAGNADKVAAYFSDNVDLAIDGKEDLYSKSQAEQILKTFFSSHPPRDFKIIHKGKSGQNEYFIGELSSDKKYRVTINSKSSGGNSKITSLTIAVS
ncbi:MAG: DUF4783 domain-containing protein [Crocinitomicaceae bacterium]